MPFHMYAVVLVLIVEASLSKQILNGGSYLCDEAMIKFACTSFAPKKQLMPIIFLLPFFARLEGPSHY